MNYLQEAFGGFNPKIDHDAAVKFVISIILIDDRLIELSYLLTDGHKIGGMEGEPGWIIERRDTGPSGDMPGYAHWPKNMHFHVHVEPSVFELAHPEIFLETNLFHRYVRKAIDVYLVKNPTRSEVVELVISKL